MATCKLCGGPLMKLGDLGDVAWFRCRNCGMEYRRRQPKPKKGKGKDGRNHSS